MDTMSVIVAAVGAFVITSVSGLVLIPFLRKLHFGQTIKEIGPTWHKKKEGTPTMGGLMFILGILVSSVAAYVLILTNPSSQNTFSQGDTIRFFANLFMAAGFGFIGFMDDYIKVIKKRNLGLRAREKVVAQLVVTTLYLVALYIAGDRSTLLVIPFIGSLDIGILYYPFCYIAIIGIVNGVNLTDGIDGLASSVTMMSSLGLLVICGILHLTGMSILSAAVAGGCLGFLLWNAYPAKVFMGDTGSMFLGGIITAVAFGIGQPLILVFVGMIYIIENLSVILQVISFKTTGKRIFKMSPIHHHFEMCGWNEVKIDVVFSIVAVLFAALGVWSVMIM